MGTTTTSTVAMQVVDTLAQAGVKHIYAITGDSLNALTDAIAKDGRIKFIHVRNEEAAAFAASAEAQLTGRLAVCAGSSGPGHVHLINGLYDANRSNAPVLAIASTCDSSMFGTGYFQETNPTLLFSNCTVYNMYLIHIC
ncbi:MAG: ubiquinone-dependent pyruvate dehydrogenase, partial [Muribaculaceae bacterium]|nr:ubiquinone-dependent pyruvate dehydrogenase [Muribaculaceae bacterium]